MSVDTNFIRLHGLPCTVGEQEVRNLFQDVHVKSVSFAPVTANNECYVEVGNKDAVHRAMELCTKENDQYCIEAFPVGEEELLEKQNQGVLNCPGPASDSQGDYIIRLRGMPYSATVNDIKEFLSGLDVANVLIDKEPGGRPSGEAFVRLQNKEHVELALTRSKNYMGSRYVEVFQSSLIEMDQRGALPRGVKPSNNIRPIPLKGIKIDRPISTMIESFDCYGGPVAKMPNFPSRFSPYGRPIYGNEFASRRHERDLDDLGSNLTIKVFMRGIPFNTIALDIEDFFKPLSCVEIKLGYTYEQRLSGDGLVTFATMFDACAALTRNKKTMGSRYIELFPATDIPYPIKSVTFRAIGGVAKRIMAYPLNRYIPNDYRPPRRLGNFRHPVRY